MIAPVEFSIIPGDPLNPQVRALIADLDAYSSSLYPSESNHFDSPETLCAPNVLMLVATIRGEVVGCGAVKNCGAWVEIKRMYLKPSARGKGVASAMLSKLLDWARGQRIFTARLETGRLNHSALRLYRVFGFKEIQAFPPYQPDPVSVFMEVEL